MVGWQEDRGFVAAILVMHRRQTSHEIKRSDIVWEARGKRGNRRQGSRREISKSGTAEAARNMLESSRTQYTCNWEGE